jgi:hypothetical protein
MGITIHYRGRINSFDLIESLSDEVKDIAQSLGWGMHLWDEDLSKPNTARVIRHENYIEMCGHVPLRGLTLFPHPDCEQLSLTFDRKGHLMDAFGMTLVASGGRRPGEGWLSMKTQFSPLEIHITVVQLLHYLKKRYVGNLEVSDEGGYWESGNAQELKRRTDSISRSLDILEGALRAKPLTPAERETPEKIAEIIEKIIKDKFGGQSG